MFKKTLTTYGVAEHCQVTPRTVNQWINEGKLKAYQTPGKHSRITVEEFLEFLHRYNMPVPPELESFNGAKRILIVDDDTGMVDSIYRFLKRNQNYSLESAYDGFEAGQKFSDFKPDLIVMDIKMPGLDGFQLCSHVRNNPKNKNIKILLMSGMAEEEEIKKAKGLADDFLMKPFSTQALKEKVETLLAH